MYGDLSITLMGETGREGWREGGREGVRSEGETGREGVGE